jgi:sulfite exporter TauE/SafE/copper chaperone CopZ
MSSNKSLKTYNFHVKGMHCKSCVILTEGELSELPGVEYVKSNLKHKSVQIKGSFGQKDPQAVAVELSKALIPHGYELTLEKHQVKIKWKDFYKAVPFALAFILFFLLLQKLGIVNLYSPDSIGYGSAFVIGLIASISTCMAVVGGLVLSVSANFAKEGDKVKPQVLFHIGRLITFFVLGGVIGLLGAVFKIGPGGTFALAVIVSIVLIILGINLLDALPWAKKLQPTMPSFIGRHINSVKKLDHTLVPFLLGILTFFLPCGFTQAMQIYSLSTGSFLVGGLTMFAFALGTLPVLAILSFSSLGLKTKTQSSVFFKTAGIVVIFFGIFNLLAAMAAFGLIEPIFNF